jgi:hypothetical protein
MKKILLILCIVVSSCSVADSPAITDLNGIWKLNIGNEYSHDTSHIIIKITDSSVIYNDIVLDSISIKKNRLVAKKNYTKDSAFKIDLTLTFETQYMWGYEYRISKTKIDSIYIFGEIKKHIKM